MARKRTVTLPMGDEGDEGLGAPIVDGENEFTGARAHVDGEIPYSSQQMGMTDPPVYQKEHSDEYARAFEQASKEVGVGNGPALFRRSQELAEQMISAKIQQQQQTQVVESGDPLESLLPLNRAPVTQPNTMQTDPVAIDSRYAAPPVIPNQPVVKADWCGVEGLSEVPSPPQYAVSFNQTGSPPLNVWCHFVVNRTPESIVLVQDVRAIEGSDLIQSMEAIAEAATNLQIYGVENGDVGELMLSNDVLPQYLHFRFGCLAIVTLLLVR